MILHAVFAYDAEVVVGRKRNPERLSFTGTVPVEVREADPSTLRAAFRWDRSVERTPEGPHEVLWDGESLWQDLHTYEPGTGFGALGKAEARKADWLASRADYRVVGATRFADNMDPLMVGFVNFQEPFPTMEEAVSVRRVASSDHDMRASQVRAAAERLLVSGDRLLVRTEEPIYHVVPGAPPRVCQPRNLTGEGYWRADEFEAMAAAHGLGPDVRPALECLVPEAVRAPLPQQALLNAAAVTKWHLAEAPGVGGGRWAVDRELREAGDELSASVLRGDADPDGSRLSAALADSLDIIDRVSSRKGRHGTVRERVEAALARYDARALANAFQPSP